MALGEILPPGVSLDLALPTVIPLVDLDILDPGWKGLKPSNSLSFAANSGAVSMCEPWKLKVNPSMDVTTQLRSNTISLIAFVMIALIR